MVDFKILKSGRSFGSSFQHFCWFKSNWKRKEFYEKYACQFESGSDWFIRTVIILFKSSNVWSLMVGRNGTPYSGGVRFTSSIISAWKQNVMIYQFICYKTTFYANSYLLVWCNCFLYRMDLAAWQFHSQLFQTNKYHLFVCLQLAHFSCAKAPVMSITYLHIKHSNVFIKISIGFDFIWNVAKWTYFSNTHNYLSTRSLHRSPIFVDYAIQNQRFSIQIENRPRNSMTLDYHVNVYRWYVENASPIQWRINEIIEFSRPNGMEYGILMEIFHSPGQCHASEIFWTSNPIWFDHFPKYLVEIPLDSIRLEYSSSVPQRMHHRTSLNARDEYLSSKWKRSDSIKLIAFEMPIKTEIFLIQDTLRRHTFFNSNICSRFKWMFFSLIRFMATLLPL